MNIQHPLRTTVVTGIVGVSTVAIAAAVGLTVLDSDAEPAPPTATPTTTVIVAERAPAASPAPTPITTGPRPAYLIIQDEIDRALAERDLGD